MKDEVVIIGAGWAGLAASVELSLAGHLVCLIESGVTVGGRARSVRRGGGGQVVDWGQHLFLGCYRETKRLLRTIGTEERLKKVKGPIRLYGKGGCSGRIRPRSLPAPVEMLENLFGLSHIGWKSRLEIGRVVLAVLMGEGLRRHSDLDGITAFEWLRGLGQGEEVMERFWRHLVISALNEQPERASAAMLETVLRLGFFAGGEASCPELPDVMLGELVADPCVRFVERNGGRLLLRSKVTGLEVKKGRVVAALLAGGASVSGSAFIAAIPPWDIKPLLCGIEGAEVQKLVRDLDAFNPSAIVTLFLATDVKLIDGPYAALLDGTFHWIFDRSALSTVRPGHYTYAFVASAARDLVKASKEELLAAACADIRSHLPTAGAFRILDAQVIKERKATFSPAPGLQQRRPRPDVLACRGLYLAGDWIDTGLPATLEGAVSSGLACARLLTGTSLSGASST